MKNEIFKIVDVAKISSKGKDYYKIVLYSNLEYLQPVFIAKEEDYKKIKDAFDKNQVGVLESVINNIERVYDKQSNSLRYFYINKY